MDKFPPTLEEQIAAVTDARERAIASASWRAGRRSFNPVMHQRHLERLDAAIATLKAMRGVPGQEAPRLIGGGE